MALSNSEITARLQNLEDYEFEEFIAGLWTRMGWDTELTVKSSDRGVDVIATKSTPYPEKELVQAKRYQQGTRVSGPEIQQYAALHNHEQDVDKVVVVTTSRFTDTALENADRSNIKTINGAELAQIIDQFGAYDIVTNYTDSVSSEDLQRQSIQSTSREKETHYDGDADFSILSRSDDITVELVGLEHVNVQVGKSGFLRTPTALDGIIAAFKLFNQMRIQVSMVDVEEIYAVDQKDNHYTAIEFGKVNFDDGWIPHGRDIGATRIDGGSRMNYVVGFSMPKRVKVAKIVFHGFDITVELDHHARQNLPDLPKAISAKLS